MEESHKAVQVSNDIDRQKKRQSIQNILANKVAELEETAAMINEAELEQVLCLLEQAQTVQVAAVGNTIPVAMDCAFKLNQLGIRAVAGTIWEEEASEGIIVVSRPVCYQIRLSEK